MIAPAAIYTQARGATAVGASADAPTGAMRNEANIAPSEKARSRDAAPFPPVHPSLTVQSISTTPGQRILLPIRVESISSAGNAVLRIQGVPDGAKLSHGRFVAPNQWIVPLADIGALELMLADVSAGRFEIVAELQADNGNPLARARSLLVVTAPTVERAPSVARDSAPSLPSFNLGDVPDQNQDKLVAQGLRLLLAGNVNSARLLFQRATDAGSGPAALLLGDTYDDIRLSQLGVQGVVPDRDKANYWYGRADELGASEAKDRLSEVNSR
jgi:hypothetical protein